MKVHIGPYKNYISVYKVAGIILFWKDKDSDEVDKLAQWLDKTPLRNFLEWCYNKRKRKVKVHIDGYDIWNMDHTLAVIILPMLQKLKDTKHGSPYVDDEDVPEHLKSTAAPPKEKEWEVDENFHQRWYYVLDEMIFAFDFIANDGEDKYLLAVPVDHEGYDEAHKRCQKGLELFGKYFRGMWT